MITKIGLRLQSKMSTTKVIVVKAAADDVDLRCGGHSMIPEGEQGPRAEADDGSPVGALLGKRYAAADVGLELLVTRAGAGTLTVGDQELTIVAPKRLPSSD
jgi:hypothetical protein